MDRRVRINVIANDRDFDGRIAADSVRIVTKPRYGNKRRLLAEVARAEGIPLNQPWHRLKHTYRRLLLHGKSGRFRGVFPFLRALERKRYKQYIRVFLRQYQKAITCPACRGADTPRAEQDGRERNEEIATHGSASNECGWLTITGG